MNFSSFNLEKAASANWMGLTATVAGDKALIVGWDGQRYTVETESGSRLKVADLVWEYDSLADEDVMECNARVAALRSDESPYNTLGKLSYDRESGAWDGEYLGESLLKLADDLEALSDDEFGGHDEPEQVEDQGLLEEIEDFLQTIAQEDSDVPGLDKFFVLLECAANPEKDIADTGIDFSDLFDMEVEEDIKEASVKESIAPLAIGAIATRLAPFAAKGLQMAGLNSLMGGILPGGQQNGPVVQVSRPAEFGMYASTMKDEYADEFALTLRESAKDNTLLEAMRVQIRNSLQSVADIAKDIWGERGDAVWYVMADEVDTADRIPALQSVLQSIPPEFHNVQGEAPALDEAPPTAMDLPSPGGPGGKPRVPGGEVGAEPAGPAAPQISQGDAGLTPGGPGPVMPPGVAPGGGIPGGPGRRAPMSSVEKTSEDMFIDELLKTSEYAPLGPGQQPQPVVTFGVGQENAQVKTELDRLVQTYINQGMDPVTAYGRASMDYQTQVSQAQSGGSMTTPGVPTAPSTYAPTPPQVTGAASGTGELPVEQDGKLRATLKCDNCGSQTIGYAGEDDFVCRTCGNKFKHNVKEEKMGSVKESKWNDTEGNPIEVGRMYKMTSPGVPVPDFVRITWVEPENVRVSFPVNGHEDDITDLGYEFEPVVDDEERPSGLDWILEGEDNEEDLVSPEVTARIAGAAFTPQEQKSFIDEEGEARNKDKLNLEGTHYRQSSYDGLVDLRTVNPGSIDPNQFLIG